MIRFNRNIVTLGVIACIFFWLLTGCATTNEQLIRAIEQGNLEQVKQSLNSGANPNKGLGEALQQKQINIVRLLLDRGADPNKCEGWPDHSPLQCPLHRAVEMNQIDIVRVLLRHGADPNLGDYYLMDELKVVDPVSKEQFAARYRISVEPGEGIELAGIEIVSDDPDVKNRGEKVLKSGFHYFRYKIKRIGGKTPLYKAIDNNNIEIIRALIESGAVVTEPHFGGYTYFCFYYAGNHHENQQVLYFLLQGKSFMTHKLAPLGEERRGYCNIVKDGDGFRAYQIPMGGARKIDCALDYARSKGNTEVNQILEMAAKTQKKR